MVITDTNLMFTVLALKRSNPDYGLQAYLGPRPVLVLPVNTDFRFYVLSLVEIAVP